MRIVSGTFSGLRLNFGKDTELRPTQDRVKEAVLNRLRHEIAGARILDLYCGIGSYGIECISMKASSVTFADTSIHFLQQNLDMLTDSCAKQGMTSDVTIKKRHHYNARLFESAVEAFQCVLPDTLSLLAKQGPFDLIFIDPPWSKPELFEQTLNLIHTKQLLSKNGQIIVEHPKKMKLDNIDYTHSTFTYGQTSVSYLQPK